MVAIIIAANTLGISANDNYPFGKYEKSRNLVSLQQVIFLW
jgi:hypothetical protein